MSGILCDLYDNLSLLTGYGRVCLLLQWRIAIHKSRGQDRTGQELELYDDEEWCDSSSLDDKYGDIIQ